MSEIIIPCLRCSADAKLRRCGDGYRVVCPECGLKGARKCETAHVGRGKAKQLAIQKWNQMQCNIVDAAIEARCWGDSATAIWRKLVRFHLQGAYLNHQV